MSQLDLIAPPGARVLVVAAHFDDEALFCGGTLKQLADIGCDVDIVVTASVTVTNQPREPVSLPKEGESARQQRRLVAFGRACGMIGVHRTFLLETHNCKPRMEEEGPSIITLISQEVKSRLGPILNEQKPDVVMTHGPHGEYGHGQHVLVHHAVRTLWRGPLVCFSASGPLKVTIDLPWKKRLLDCYRYGTTQDVQWTPYLDPPDAATQAWLGDVEGFKKF